MPSEKPLLVEHLFLRRDAYGLKHGQKRTAPYTPDALWFSGKGLYLGRGALTLQDLANLARDLPLGQQFLAVPASRLPGIQLTYLREDRTHQQMLVLRGSAIASALVAIINGNIFVTSETMPAGRSYNYHAGNGLRLQFVSRAWLKEQLLPQV